MRLSIFLFIAIFAATGAHANSVREGMAAWGKNEFKVAIEIFQPLADRGNAEAQFAIGSMYAAGVGFKKNSWIAVTWFGMAARQGHLEAQITLAEKYLSGTNGLTQNFTAAAGWYRKAAGRGAAKAQYRLGQLYAEGRGVKRNFVAAHVWFNLAAAQGHGGAAAKRSLISLKLTPAEVIRAQKQAGNWVKK